LSIAVHAQQFYGSKLMGVLDRSRIMLQGGPLKEQATSEITLNRIENPPMRLDIFIKFDCERSTRLSNILCAT